MGDQAAVKFAATGRTTIRVGGVYQANVLLGSYLVSNSYFLAHFQNEQPGAVLLRTDGSSGVERRSRRLWPVPERQVQCRRS